MGRGYQVRSNSAFHLAVQHRGGAEHLVVSHIVSVNLGVKPSVPVAGIRAASSDLSGLGGKAK